LCSKNFVLSGEALRANHANKRVTLSLEAVVPVVFRVESMILSIIESIILHCCVYGKELL
jgi:hypothetical protein